MVNTDIEKIVVELAEYKGSCFFGKYRGTVENVNDKENLGRITAKVPDVYGEAVSPWALPSVPFAGKNHGLVVLPEKGDGVWIEFEAGDVSRPIWVGFWWSKKEMPKPGGSKTRILATSAGHKVILDDDKKSLQILHSNGSSKITMTNDGKIVINGAKVVVEANDIELVENSTHPVPFGDELMNYLNQLVNILNAHTHPGQTAIGIPVNPAPPTPRLPEASTTLFSDKVKTG